MIAGVIAEMRGVMIAGLSDEMKGVMIAVGAGMARMTVRMIPAIVATGALEQRAAAKQRAAATVAGRAPVLAGKEGRARRDTRTCRRRLSMGLLWIADEGALSQRSPCCCARLNARG
ncbi:unnamed protein product [Symbiodinium sp. CCMP2592]|nr:unnamed protein product [Symbiodinium sp. CCMP2592]